MCGAIGKSIPISFSLEVVFFYRAHVAPYLKVVFKRARVAPYTFWVSCDIS